MAGKKRKPLTGARTRGLRTLQHQTLPRRIRDAIETEVWMRGLLARRTTLAARGARWATKDQVLTFWIDSRLMQQVRRRALREGVKVSRFIEAALSAFVAQQVPAELGNFRDRVELEAEGLYAQLHGARAAGRTLGPKA
jgi:hypothetical protein